MVRRLDLLTAVLLASVLVVGEAAASAAEAAPCSSADTRAGTCTTASSDGSGVDLTGRVVRHRPGAGAHPGTPGRPLTEEEEQALLDELCVGNGHCSARGPNTLNPLILQQNATPPTPGARGGTVTIADVARFLPAGAGLHAEPEEWAVVGVPANFWVGVTPLTVTGELLGRAAEVRFTPEAYRFDYGDGSVRTTAEPGASWTALGQEELTPTSTSHVYADRGDLLATATVVYSAQYRLADGPWTGVAGAVSGTTPPQRKLVVVERTALTTRG